MKYFKFTLYFIGFITLVSFPSCNEEPFSDGGEGKVILSTSINGNMETITRADENALKESLMIWISNEKGVVRKYNNENPAPSEITLLSGHYVAEAWAGDSVPASFERTWFKGLKEFDVNKEVTIPVQLQCKIANVGAQVKYDNNIDKALSEFTMTIGHSGKDGKLTFVGREDTEKTAYFMMPSFDKNLSYELKGKQVDGSDFVFKGMIEEAKPATKYILNVTCEEKTNEVGGAIFTIRIDEKEEIINSTIEMVGAPSIQGYGFNLNNPIIAEEGLVGSLTVYVSSATKLKNVKVQSELFTKFDFLGGHDDFDLLVMSENYKNSLEAKGINFSENYNSEKDETLFRIIFEDTFTNNLDKGDYEINFEATDKNDKSTKAVMTIMVGDVPVLTGEVDSKTISYTKATLKGTVEKEGTEKIGFNYREIGTNNWIYVDGSPSTRSYSKGTEYYAELTGLKSGQEYEYAAVSDGFISQVVSRFSTLAHLQLPNAGFEEWGTYNDAVIPALNYNDAFWDTGNHGSKTLKIQVTDKSTTYKHSGNYSACLKTQYPSVAGIGKLGAGNIFIGNYLATDGTNGEIGFGRAFNDKPISIKLWVRYEPQIAKKTGIGSNVNVGEYIKDGDLDQGQIYIALTTDQTYLYSNSSSEKNNTYWPAIVKTKTKELFNKDAENVIAYGEYNFLKATDGDGMIQIEIPFEYYKKDIVPSYIIFTASASRYGDYFQGAVGSTMYLDDIELVYEDE